MAGKRLSANTRDDGRRCCVKDCHSKGTCDGRTKFYSFPFQPWFQERRQKWIELMKRTNDDGSPWKPGPRSYVCSKHFVGNEKSDHPLSPSFLPSIFPKSYKVKPPTATQVKKFEIIRKRDNQRIVEQSLRCAAKRRKEREPTDDTPPTAKSTSSARPRCKDAFAQTERLTLPIKNLSAAAKKQEKLTCDRGTSMYILPEVVTGFRGFSSIKTKKDMVTFAGVSLDEFDELFGRLHFQKKGKMDRKDRLLLVLHKLKTNVKFSILAIIFGVSQQTASAVFKDVFKELNEKASDFMNRLSHQSDRESTPEVFNYDAKQMNDCSGAKMAHFSTVDLQAPGTFMF